MKKPLLIICILLTTFKINAQTKSDYKVLYDRLGLHLYYKYDYYNTIKIKDDEYDQYKITGFAEYDGESPIFVPTYFYLTYNKLMGGIKGRYFNGSDVNTSENAKYIPYSNLMKKMPNSSESINFSSMQKGQQTHNFWVPGTLAMTAKYDTSADPRAINQILLNGYKSQCYIYILVDHGQPVPEPEWAVSNSYYDFIYVEPYKRKNNWPGGPSTFDDCLAGSPIGNAGDMPPEEKAKEENKTTNSNSNTIYSNLVEKPQLRSVEELKSYILENLRKNTHDITFDDSKISPSRYYTNKSSNHKFNINNDNFYYEYALDSWTTKNGRTYSNRSTIFKKCIFKLSSIKYISKDQPNKDYPPQLNFSYDCECSVEQWKEFDEDGKNIYDHPISKGKEYQLWGYDFGVNDKNLKELNQAIIELAKQLKK